MKFRSKTGEILTYRDIIPVLCKNGCNNCPIIADVLKHDDQSCQMWILNHPHEAARLMGFEVEEDDHIPQAEKKEEANMDKPRICEVLGVEVGEHFQVYGNAMTWHITSGGYIVRDDGKRCVDDVIYLAINHPDRIIRKPRWTEQEVEDAAHLKKILDSRKIGYLTREWGGELRFCDNYGKSESVFSSISLCPAMFPSIQPGQSVTLDEIIGGAE